MGIETVLTENLDIWTSAIERKNGAGRGRTKKVSFYGIEKLRALILELAVRGKLVPQNPNDEPASILLKGIATENGGSIRRGPSRKAEHRLSTGVEEQPYELPTGWVWTRLQETAEVIRGVSYSKSDASNAEEVGKIPLLRGGNIQKKLEFTDLVYVPVEKVNERQFVRPGDMVIAMSSGSAGLVGKAAQFTENMSITFGAFCGVVRPCSEKLEPYFRFFFETPFYRSQTTHGGKGIGIQNLNKSALETLLLPLPPLAEQQRIVTKVDELMALCDTLQAETSDAVEAHQVLVEQLLATLSDSQDAKELTRNWAWIEEHFDILFTTEDSVDQLKQTILQLAVMGKLVPQDPNDEPASELLKRVKAEKARLIADGKIKKSKSLPPVDEHEEQFDLPAGWEWVRFEDCVDPEFTISYGVLVPGEHQDDGVPFVRIADLSIIHPPELPEKSISSEIDAQYARTRLNGGEILMGVVGSIGKLGVAPESWRGANIARAICRIVPSQFFDKAYLLWLLQSDFMQSNFRDDIRVLAQPTLNIKLIRLATTPVPPLLEQKLIVKKLDELMTLCDALKSNLSRSNDQRFQIADVVVSKAVA